MTNAGSAVSGAVADAAAAAVVAGDNGAARFATARSDAAAVAYASLAQAAGLFGADWALQFSSGNDAAVHLSTGDVFVAS